MRWWAQMKARAQQERVEACEQLRLLRTLDSERRCEPSKTIPGHDPDFAYGLARTLVDRQFATLDANDTKITSLLAASLTLISLFASVLALRPQHFNWALAPLVVAAVCVVAVSRLSYLAQKPRRWQAEEAIATAVALEEGGTKTREAKWQTVWLLEWGLQHNNSGNKAKVWVVRVCMILVQLQTLTLLVGVVLLAAA